MDSKHVIILNFRHFVENDFLNRIDYRSNRRINQNRTMIVLGHMVCGYLEAFEIKKY